MKKPNIKQTEHIMRSIAEAISNALPGYGFHVTIFEFGKPEVGNYISNLKRDDMIKALREQADRLEQNQDIPRPSGEA